MKPGATHQNNKERAQKSPKEKSRPRKSKPCYYKRSVYSHFLWMQSQSNNSFRFISAGYFPTPTFCCCHTLFWWRFGCCCCCRRSILFYSFHFSRSLLLQSYVWKFHLFFFAMCRPIITKRNTETKHTGRRQLCHGGSREHGEQRKTKNQIAAKMWPGKRSTAKFFLVFFRCSSHLYSR